VKVNYFFGRAIGIALRPLTLVASNATFGTVVASQLAAAYLAVVVVNGLLSFDLHRDFYSSYFSSNKAAMVANLHRDYLSSLFLISLFGTVIICVFFLIAIDAGPTLFLAVGAYFFTERMIDEVLRFELYSERFESWGGIVMRRGLCQLAGFGIACVLAERFGAEPTGVLVAAMAAGNGMIFFVTRQGAKSAHVALRRAGDFRRWSQVAARVLRANKTYWVLSSCSILFSVADRLVVSAVSFRDLAYFSLLASCFSIITMAFDFMVVSLVRKRLLRGDVSSSEIFRSARFLVIFLVSTCVAVAATLLLPFFYPGVTVSVSLMVLIFFCQVLIAFVALPREIVYWHRAPITLVRIEMVAALGAAAWVIISMVLSMSLAGVLVGVVIVLLARFVVFEWQSSQCSKWRRRNPYE